jgi:hydrogenase expression/formation protein HypE
MDDGFPLGKLPPDVLAALLTRAPQDDSVLIGPGIGMDCAVVDAGDRLLVYKSDPVTFVSDQIGYYLAHVNINDIATTGAVPRWLLVTLLLPEEATTGDTVNSIMDQIYDVCRLHNIAVIGGHTEITAGLDRPIAVGMLVGEVARDRLVTPRGARNGDRLLLTKGVPIEATSILAREFPQRLHSVLSDYELTQARQFLFDPGISVLNDAKIALAAGEVTAMHDPTEGGLVTALWELAEAADKTILFDPTRVVVPELSKRICRAFNIDPFTAIASGALLLTVPTGQAKTVVEALLSHGIPCDVIGEVLSGPPTVKQPTAAGVETCPRPAVDGITLAFQ